MPLEQDNVTWRSTSPNIEKFGQSPFYKINTSTTMVVTRSKNEAVLTIVGVLKSFDLPPVKKNSLPAARIPYARAYVEVVGYNSKLFAAAMGNVQDLAYELSTRFTADSVSHWVAAPDSDVYGPSLSSSCRYYTIGTDIPVESRINFQKHIDLAGTLSQHIRDRVAHCVENDGAYLCVKKAKYVTKEPSGFRVRDIVEMGFELVVFRQAIRGEEDKHIYLLPKPHFMLERLHSLPKRMEFEDLSRVEEDYPDTRKRMAMLRLLEGDREGDESHEAVQAKAT
ncbi:hypothetical protein B0H17DRAFT_1129323 [Mycena rosella]|uniref:Uncharacterized protein n=1 Tax=Mycena rosella TaxID=1033263 RepID=A0AAD7DTC0_MYCRO|nr:hypothetical protein B0H17DRAFT_1129323 [Mycena rosella]